MSEQDLSLKKAQKDYQKTLQQTENTLRDIGKAIQEIKDTKKSVEAIAHSVGLSIEKFSKLSTKDLAREATLSHEEREECIKTVKAFYDNLENKEPKTPKHKSKRAKPKNTI